MGSLERRIRELEAATGGSGEGCERCGDTTVVRMGDGVYSVSKRGQKFPPAAALAFVREEEPDNGCPVCGTLRRTLFKVGSYKRDPDQS